MTFWQAAIALTTVWALVIAVVVILQRRSPAATLAWILALAFLPVIGWAIFRLIGPQRLERTRRRRRLTRKVIEESVGALHEIDAPGHHRAQLARVAIGVGEAGPLRTDGVEIYTEGAAAYAALAAAIDAAQHHVHLEYYIWEPDQIGTRLRDQLCAKARAGVRVRVLVDGTGSARFRRRFSEPLRAAGVEVAHFNPVSLLGVLWRRADLRSHRKIVVCDGRVGFTGGMNVADDQTTEFRGERAWRDTHVRFTGSAVRALQRIFAEHWMFATARRVPADAAYFPSPASVGGCVLQVIGAGPDGDAFPIQRTLFAAICQAAERLWLTTPYFVPDEAVQTAICAAALRGVDVRLIVPRRGDSRMVDLAARSYFPELLRSGVRVFEYTPRFVHAKTVVVDDDVAIIGTANLDNRSFRLDFEVIAVMYGGTANATLADAFTADLAHCEELRAAALARVRFWSRLGQATARLFSPLL